MSQHSLLIRIDRLVDQRQPIDSIHRPWDSWKKWLAIYAVVGAIVYLIIYIALTYNSGAASGGGGLY
jgi:hypothetical protein